MHRKKNSSSTELSWQVVHLNRAHTARLLLLVAKSHPHALWQNQWYHCRPHTLEIIFMYLDNVGNSWNSSEAQTAGLQRHEQGYPWVGMWIHRNCCSQEPSVTPKHFDRVAWRQNEKIIFWFGDHKHELKSGQVSLSKWLGGYLEGCPGSHLQGRPRLSAHN